MSQRIDRRLMRLALHPSVEPQIKLFACQQRDFPLEPTLDPLLSLSGAGQMLAMRVDL